MESIRWGSRRSRWLAGLAVLSAVMCTASWYAVFRGKAAAESSLPQVSSENKSEAAVYVEVITPRPGGIERVCLQPGSVEPIEAADLYTKVSGFLVEQNVDIGSRVKAGEVLARISVPEYEKQVKQDEADVARADARVEQMKAAINTAEADLGAATSAVASADAEKSSKASSRALREKQRDRIKNLAARMAIEAKLVDEHEDYYQAALSAELAATEAISAAKQKEASARAKIKQAQADLKYAEAEAGTARARLEKSQVFVDYATIRSPYSGVVTKRNFHRGDFVRAADSGGERMPVLAVERTDVMRVVIQVPERDVPYVDRGDPAVVEVDALPGVVFKTRGDDKVEVSLMAASEDPTTRMMRTEVHVKNSEGKLRRGMFGRVILTLQSGSSDAFRIPTAALIGKADGGKASIRLVRNGKVCIVPVRYGADNGSEIEVLSGLTASDRVIIKASGVIEDGASVTIREAPLPK